MDKEAIFTGHLFDGKTVNFKYLLYPSFGKNLFKIYLIKPQCSHIWNN